MVANVDNSNMAWVLLMNEAKIPAKVCSGVNVALVKIKLSTTKVKL